jgi:thiol-disulfide isomerase/thioredoxin
MGYTLSMMNRILVPLCACLLLTACPSASRSTRSAEGPRLPREAVTLDFEDVATGKEVSTQRFRGKPVILFFFTTWCTPCQLEAERLHQVHAAAGRDRVAILGICIDLDRRLVPPFVEAAGFNFPVVYGDPGLVRSSPLGPVQGVPRIVILDAAGRPVVDLPRPVDGRTIFEALKPYLGR